MLKRRKGRPHKLSYLSPGLLSRWSAGSRQPVGSINGSDHIISGIMRAFSGNVGGMKIIIHFRNF